MVKKNPLVSICILTYNQECTIGETIENILNQKCNFEYEIIIGEDCSTDRTLEICQKYQSIYPSIIDVITSKTNLGLMLNFKNVTERVRGKYFASCAGDDFWHDQNKLELQVEFMEINMNYGMVHSGCKMLYVNNGNTKEYIRKKTNMSNVFEAILTGTYGNIIASTALVRTCIFRKYVNIEEYIIKKYQMEDFPMWLDISYNSKIGYIDKSLITYRISENSISQTKNIEKMLAFLKSRWEVQNDYAIKYNVKNHIIRYIKKDKNRICINSAFNSENFKEALLWIRNIYYKNLITNFDLKQSLMLILIFFNIKNKRLNRIRHLWCLR